MLSKPILTIIFVLSLAAYSNAADKTCTKEDAIKAENDTDTLKDWGRVYLSYKKYSHCDDGSISEGYSDKICHLLAHDWQQIGLLNSMVDKDKKFAAFIVKHIDDTAKVSDVRQIFNNSTRKCPLEAKEFCNMITKRICYLEKEINNFKSETKGSILKRPQVLEYCK
jgi:hypothetical protein